MGSKESQMEQQLRITEIYQTIQGEAAHAGWPCVMVRLTGCPLRCRWCDTVYGFQGGKDQTFAEIESEIKSFGIKRVELTGGEPLAQKPTPQLIERLINDGYTVMIETGGSESIADLHPKTHIIMDIKCPGSGMADKNLWSNLEFLKPSDEIKFVVADQADFKWAVDVIRKYQLEERCNLLFSAAFGLVQPKDVAEWILAEKLQARLNLQLHKYIWSPRAKGV